MTSHGTINEQLLLAIQVMEERLAKLEGALRGDRRPEEPWTQALVKAMVERLDRSPASNLNLLEVLLDQAPPHLAAELRRRYGIYLTPQAEPLGWLDGLLHPRAAPTGPGLAFVGSEAPAPRTGSGAPRRTNRVGEPGPFGFKIYSRSWIYDPGAGARVGFPRNKQHLVGPVLQHRCRMLFYAEHMKRVFGVVQVTGGPVDLSAESNGKYPQGVLTEWAIGPKYGLSLAQLGLGRIRPRIGDTFAFLTETEFRQAESLLLAQKDVDLETLRRIYADIRPSL